MVPLSVWHASRKKKKKNATNAVSCPVVVNRQTAILTYLFRLLLNKAIKT